MKTRSAQSELSVKMDVAGDWMKNKIFKITPLISFLFFLLALPIVFAQSSVVSLFVNPTAGSPDNEYTFTITWNTLATQVLPDFSNVELQYKKSGESDSAFRTYTKITNIQDSSSTLKWSNPPLSSASETKRSFRLVPSQIGEIPSVSENPTFTGVYNFRVVDHKYDTGGPNSNSVSLSFSSKCVRSPSEIVLLKVVAGTNYQGTGTSNALVNVEEGFKLGSGLKVYFDFSVRNQDSNCGDFQKYQIDISGNGVEPETGANERIIGYKARIISRTNPDGTVTQNPGNTLDIRSGAAATVFRIEVEAADDIAPKDKPFGVVTAIAKNLDADREGISSIVEGGGRISVNLIRTCRESPPTIKITPDLGRAGFPGDEVEYLVSIRNENTGNPQECTETFSIIQAGVNEDTSGRCQKEQNVPDDCSWRWGFTARYKSGGTGGILTDVFFNNVGKTSTFLARQDHIFFRPSTPIKFTLGPSDDLISGSTRECKSCVKTLVLKVRSYGQEVNRGPRSVAICVDESNACGTNTYNVLDRFVNKPTESDVGKTITDSFLDTAEATITSGGQIIIGVPITTKPITVESIAGIDDVFFKACKTCTLKARAGLLIDKSTGKTTCVEGNPSGSTVTDVTGTRLDNKARLDDQNWIYVPLESAKRIITDTARKSKSFSCEIPPAGVGRTSTLTSAITVPSTITTATIVGTPKEQCSACTDLPNKGYVSTTSKCESGDPLKSTESTANVQNKNWFFYKTNTFRNAVVNLHPEYKGALSCEELTTTSSSPTATSTPTSTTNTCIACTDQPNKGYVSTTGKCESGDPLKSLESSATATSKNWYFYTDSRFRDRVVVAHPEYKGSLACNELTTSTSATAPTTSTTAPTTTSAKDACTVCTDQPNKGYVSTNGKCESGEPLKSLESSATAVSKTWYFYSKNTYRDRVVLARPEYKGALSCEELPTQ